METVAETPTTSFIQKSLIGMSVLGDLLSPDPKRMGTTLAMILTDNHKEYIKACIFYREFHRQPTEGEDWMNNAVVAAMYERVKTYARNITQQIFDEAGRQDLLEQQKKFEDLRKKLADTNKPHPVGSVAEIATKLGTSKSEVRRMKQEGTLDATLREKGFM